MQKSEIIEALRPVISVFDKCVEDLLGKDLQKAACLYFKSNKGVQK